MVIKNCLPLKYFKQCQLKPCFKSREQNPQLGAGWGQHTPPAGPHCPIMPCVLPVGKRCTLKSAGIKALTLDAKQ